MVTPKTLETPLILSPPGVVNAAGHNPEQFWQTLERGIPTLTPRDDLVPEHSIHVGEIAGTLPNREAWPQQFQTRNNQLAAAALIQIQDHIQIAIDRFGPARIGIVVGTSTSGIAEAETALAEYSQVGTFPKQYSYQQQEFGSLAEFTRYLFKTNGPAYTISTACSSSAKALASAYHLIRADLCDAVIVGGADSLCRLTVNGFHALGALSSGLSRPFAQDRDGINIGEAAAFFCLHKEDNHLRTGDNIALLGIGESSDAHHMSAPDPEGEGATSAMRDALHMAGLGERDIDYINLHGTGTPSNDQMEAKAVHRLFGQTVPCSSTKPFTGHTLGAAGSTEAAICWLALSKRNERYSRPKQINLESAPPAIENNPTPATTASTVDPALPALSLVTSKNSNLYSDTPLRYCLSNSFAFGGNNISLLLGRTS
ncbi:3-oxoacyl-(acyl-carrier-protein) synthase [Oleiphilus messinensis]|uniref:3-oxoacyl-(Acyl-carrier-protein) synthase n=1 Tax=Oleiphilus messinensis TaxID=141451 RepID=A0A1Y0I3Q2_9GAMM|nr:beta-ketoacyl-[acyl-carrier-protein] synthase family protein [Oleiphilus messinensis]ARU55107.1 3-oxoacyl-(acyl-carrier-protein) synthase [Oleiphilus messinensis]